MDWAGWATFGFAATVVLTTIMVAAQLAGRSRMDMPMMLGTLFVEDPDRARVVGFLIHLINGQVLSATMPSVSCSSPDAVRHVVSSTAEESR